MKADIVIWGSITLVLLSACTSTGTPRDQNRAPGKLISYVTQEFTYPRIEVSKNGKEFYFDSMGEIYRASIGGGTAYKLDLEEGWKDQPVLSPDGHKIAFRSDSNGALALWVASTQGPGDPVLYEERKGADVVSAVWASSSELVTSGMGQVHPFTFGLAGTSKADSGTKLSATSSEAQLSPASLIGRSTDGRYLYLFRYLGVGLSRLDRNTGEEVAVKYDRKLISAVHQFRVSEDGKRIGFASEVRGQKSPTLSVMNVEDGTVEATNCLLERSQKRSQFLPAAPTYAFMPDGRSILLSRDGGFWLCALDGQTRSVEVSAQVNIKVASRAVWNERMSYGPQLRFIAANRDASEISFTARQIVWLLDPKTGDIESLSGDSDSSMMSDFSPSGDRVAYVTLNSSGSVLSIRSTQDNEVVQVLSSAHIIANPKWSPDAKKIAYVERSPALGKDQAAIKWFDLESQKSGDIGPAGMISNTNRAYPNIYWDKGGEGIFYTQDYSNTDRSLRAGPVYLNS